MSAQLCIRKNRLVEWLEDEEKSVEQQIENINKVYNNHFDMMFNYDVLSHRLKWIKSQLKKLKK
jgi:hypothetical protein